MCVNSIRLGQKWAFLSSTEAILQEDLANVTHREKAKVSYPHIQIVSFIFSFSHNCVDININNLAVHVNLGAFRVFARVILPPMHDFCWILLPQKSHTSCSLVEVGNIVKKT